MNTLLWILLGSTIASLVILEGRDLYRKVLAYKAMRAKKERKAKITFLIKAYILSLPELNSGYTYQKKVHGNKIRVKVSQRRGRNAWEILYRKTLTLWK